MMYNLIPTLSLVFYVIHILIRLPTQVLMIMTRFTVTVSYFGPIIH